MQHTCKICVHVLHACRTLKSEQYAQSMRSTHVAHLLHTCNNIVQHMCICTHACCLAAHICCANLHTCCMSIACMQNTREIYLMYIAVTVLTHLGTGQSVIYNLGMGPFQSEFACFGAFFEVEEVSLSFGCSLSLGCGRSRLEGVRCIEFCCRRCWML